MFLRLLLPSIAIPLLVLFSPPALGQSQPLADLKARAAALNDRIAVVSAEVKARDLELAARVEERRKLADGLVRTSEAMFLFEAQRRSDMYGSNWQKYFPTAEGRNEHYNNLLRTLDELRWLEEDRSLKLDTFDGSVRELTKQRDAQRDALVQARLELAGLLIHVHSSVRVDFLDRVVILDDRGTPVYEARWSNPPMDPVWAKYTALLALQRTADGVEPALLVQYQAAEQALRDADAKWQAINREVIDEIYAEFALRSVLELMDSAVSVASAGSGAPAALVYEAGFRWVEAALSGGQSDWSFPTLPAELIDLRDQYAASLDRGGLPLNAEPAGAPLATLVKNAAYADAKGQAKETFKNGLESILNVVEQKVAGGLTSAELDAWLGAKSQGAVWWMLGGGFAAEPQVQATGSVLRLYLEGSRKFEKLIDDGIRGFTGGRWPTVGDEVLANQGLWKSIKKELNDGLAKGLVVGVATNVAKDAVLLGYDVIRTEKFIELAMAELEWFLRRNELHAARLTLHSRDEMIDAIAAAAEALIDQRCNNCTQRKLEVAWMLDCAPGAFIPANEGLRFEFRHGAPGGGASAELRLNVDGSVIPLRGGSGGYDRSVGLGSLELRGRAAMAPSILLPNREKLLNGFTLEYTGAEVFDADPATIAYLDRNLDWVNLESGPDTHHFINRLVLVGVNWVGAGVPGAYKETLPGAAIPITYVTPDMRLARTRIAVFPKSAPETAQVDASVSQIFIDWADSHRVGTGELYAPVKPGDYEVRLFDWQIGRTWSKFNLGVREPDPPPEPVSSQGVEMSLSASRVVIGAPLRVDVRVPEDRPDLKGGWWHIRLRHLGSGYEWDLSGTRLPDQDAWQVTAHDMPGEYLVYYTNYADKTVLASARYVAEVTPTPGALAFGGRQTTFHLGQPAEIRVTPPEGRYYALAHWAPMVSLAKAEADCVGGDFKDFYLPKDWKPGQTSTVTFSAPSQPGAYEFVFFDRNMKSFALDTLRMNVVVGSVPGAISIPRSDFHAGETIAAEIHLPSDRYYGQSWGGPQLSLDHIDDEGRVTASVSRVGLWSGAYQEQSSATFAAPDEPGKYRLNLSDRYVDGYVLDYRDITVTSP